MHFELYGCDCESTGLDPLKNEPIEITFIRLSTDECKTWCLKPLNPDNIEADALRVNGHKLDDLLHRTAEGRSRYLNPERVLVDMENWLAKDELPSDQRILLGHNVHFDREMLASLWRKCDSYDTFPLNNKYALDTMQIEFFLDHIKGEYGEGYSLRNLARNYKVKQDKAHTAEDDTKVMTEIFRHQVKRLIKG